MKWLHVGYAWIMRVMHPHNLHNRKWVNFVYGFKPQKKPTYSLKSPFLNS